jgi:hypothetical protein
MQHFVRHLTRWTLSAMVIASLLATVTVQPAAAHEMNTFGPDCGLLPGSPNCGMGSVSSDHTTVEACDRVADGDGFDVVWTTRSGKSGRVGDSNGSAEGCGRRTVGTASDPVITIQVCNRTEDRCAPPLAVF